jgi:hypothetical protein
MKLVLKSLFIFILLNSSFLFSQFNVNNMSLEAGYGYTGAIEPYYKGFKSNFRE